VTWPARSPGCRCRPHLGVHKTPRPLRIHRHRRDGRAHTDIDDDDSGSDLSGDDVDGRPAGEEVRHHLSGDLGRPGRDALDEHAVIAGEDHDGRRLRDRWRAPAGDPRQTLAQVLQATERAGRLGQAALMLVGGGSCSRVGRCDPSDRFVEGGQAGSVLLTGSSRPSAGSSNDATGTSTAAVSTASALGPWVPGPNMYLLKIA